MNPIDILRRVTQPMTDAESEAMIRAKYGVGKENVSNDDPMSIQRASQLVARSNAQTAKDQFIETPVKSRKLGFVG